MSKLVLHIAEAPGGVERYLVTLLTKMKKYPEFEHVLVCSSTFDKDKFRGLVKSVAVIDSMHNAISASDLKAVIQVRNVIKHYKPDIVYCHSSKAGAIGRVADMWIHNKVIYNAHGWAFNMKRVSVKKIFFYEVVERMLAFLSEKIVCISEYEKISALEHRICKEDKLLVINNGINFEEYKKLNPKSREELGIPKQSFVVGMIGRLAVQKSPDIFVEMAKLVKKQIPEAYFIIVGDDISDGKYRSAIEEQIKNEGLFDSFLITGWVDNPLDYMAVFDVATLLSRWEGFGLVLPEYMLLGKPIVATKADAIPYVVGNAGILVDIDDYKHASEEIIKLHDNPQMISHLLNKENARVNMFNIDLTCKNHYDLFKQLSS